MPPGIRRHPWRLLALLLCLLSSLATPALAGVSEAHDEFASLIEDSLTELSAKRGPTDPQYFSGGVWRSGDPGCWSCQVGPATAAAALWRENRSDFHRWLAVTTFDTAIRRFRMRNGSFGRADDSPDIATMFFGLELGHSYLLLEPSLERGRARRWRAALAGGADFLIANGNVHWYTNGNINLGNTTLFYLAWRATGHKRFIDAYEESWRFLLNPPQARWPGFGLQYMKRPTAADGRDGAGYLAESGGEAPGFDPEYTHLQADIASRLFLLSGDPRARRIANLTVNAVLTRTAADWTVNTSGGSRHGTPGRRVPFNTPALHVMVAQGGRTDLIAKLGGQRAMIDAAFRGALTYSHRNYYRGLGLQAAVMFESTRPGAPEPKSLRRMHTRRSTTTNRRTRRARATVPSSRVRGNRELGPSRPSSPS